VVNRDDVQYAGLANSEPFDPLLLRMGADLPSKLRAARRRPPRLLLRNKPHPRSSGVRHPSAVSPDR